MLAALGDDRTRFADARALKAYAGSAPFTCASGKSLVIHYRKVKNQRLAAAGYVWAFASLKAPAPRAHYDRRRDDGDRHSSALRDAFNRLLGCLFRCLQTGRAYDELTAFPTRFGGLAGERRTRTCFISGAVWLIPLEGRDRVSRGLVR
ncbi:transposase [Nonomuraea sediminis]|uniref:transposase n=1 Tax=Nonomuraea sediminis TaxID=2835864 RepID=UPI0027E04A2C|nr:transposase [Nonomuraea sediminis]